MKKKIYDFKLKPNAGKAVEWVKAGTNILISLALLGAVVKLIKK